MRRRLLTSPDCTYCPMQRRLLYRLAQCIVTMLISSDASQHTLLRTISDRLRPCFNEKFTKIA